MKFKIIIALSFLLGAFFIYFYINSNIKMESTKIIYIQNGGVKAGILPEIGGTLAFLSKNNSNNILKSDSSLWNNNTKPVVSAFADFMPYNGHTIWVGPQCDWWVQQNLNEDRKAEKAMWPPDPFISYGMYEVVEISDTSLKILSPKSPVSNIQIEKSFVINPDGTLYHTVAFTNISNKEIAWDIWFNTRIEGFDNAYVQATDDNIKVVPVLNENSTEMPFEIKNGFFKYNSVLPPKEFKERSSKAYIYPQTPSIYAFVDSFLLQINFEKHNKSNIHNEQALVEIYNHTEHNEKNHLTELEYHAPYKKLKPGESMDSWQVWEIKDYSGQNTPDEQITFLLQN